MFEKYQSTPSPLASRRSVADSMSAPGSSPDDEPIPFDATRNFSIGGGVPGAESSNTYGGASPTDPTKLPWQSPTSGGDNVLDAWSLPPIAQQIAGALRNPQTDVQEFAAPRKPAKNPRTGAQEFAAPNTDYASYVVDNNFLNKLTSKERDALLPYISQNENRHAKDQYTYSVNNSDFNMDNFRSYMDNPTSPALLGGYGTAAGQLHWFAKDRAGLLDKTPDPVTPPSENPVSQVPGVTPRTFPTSQSNPLAVIAGTPGGTPSPGSSAALNFSRDPFLAAREASAADAGGLAATGEGITYKPQVLSYLQENPTTGAQEFFMKGTTKARGMDTPVFTLNNAIAGSGGKKPQTAVRRIYG